MNRQKEIVITVTYNELGVIVDVKTEPLETKLKQMADRKTEPQTEEHQELEAYRKCIKSRSFWDAKHCDGCMFYDDCPFDPREDEDEPQTERIE